MLSLRQSQEYALSLVILWKLRDCIQKSIEFAQSQQRLLLQIQRKHRPTLHMARIRDIFFQ